MFHEWARFSNVFIEPWFYSAGLLPEERTQRDRRADVHAAAHVQENQTDEDVPRQVRGETDRRGDRQPARVRGQYI